MIGRDGLERSREKVDERCVDWRWRVMCFFPPPPLTDDGVWTSMQLSTKGQFEDVGIEG